MRKIFQLLLPIFLVCMVAATANAQAFKVQCPMTTALHSGSASDQGAIKCQQISGGDGYATMADGTQTYLFAFGPLSGLKDLASGKPGTQLNTTFMKPYDPLNGVGSDPNGAVGIVPDVDAGGGYTGHVDPPPGYGCGCVERQLPRSYDGHR